MSVANTTGRLATPTTTSTPPTTTIVGCLFGIDETEVVNNKNLFFRAAIYQMTAVTITVLERVVTRNTDV